jgi:hypothetical protein
MMVVARIVLALSLAFGSVALPGAFARDDVAASAAVHELLPFATDDGLARLARSTAKVNFAALANQFEAQSNTAFCGPTSAAIVLNALHGRDSGLPRDRSRLHAEDMKHMPESCDLVSPRFTQDNVIGKGQKKRAQVFGEPITINGKSVRDLGYQIRQLDEMLRANGAATRLVIVDDTKNAQDIRDELVRSLKRAGDFAIVNFRREAVGQRGGGHISPLGAYDAESDSLEPRVPQAARDIEALEMVHWWSTVEFGAPPLSSLASAAGRLCHVRPVLRPARNRLTGQLLPIHRLAGILLVEPALQRRVVFEHRASVHMALAR